MPILSPLKKYCPIKKKNYLIYSCNKGIRKRFLHSRWPYELHNNKDFSDMPEMTHTKLFENFKSSTDREKIDLFVEDEIKR